MGSGVFEFAGRGGVEAVHDEETFRHFLAIERARAVRANRSLLLLLVSPKPQVMTNPLMSRTIAAALFSSLTACLREIDLLGWLREGRVAGAVLAQGGESAQHVARQVADRVARSLDAAVAGQVRIRVIELRGPSRW